MLNRKNIITLLKGNIFAQVLPILSYPIITRLFSAEDFGVYSTILAIIMTFTVISILKLDQALPIAEEKERIILIRFGLTINLIINFFLFFLLIIVSNFMFKDTLSLPVIGIIVIVVIINGCNNMLTGLNVSLSQFNYNARYQVFRSLLITMFQIIFGLIGYLQYGLVVAFLMSQLISLFYLLYVNKENLKGVLINYRIKCDYLLVRSKFTDFLIYLTPTSMINTFGANLPILLFTTTYGLFFSGLYGLVTRAFMTPLNMISISIAQPFLKELSHFKDSIEDMNDTAVRTFKLLALISIVPITLFTFNMEYIFNLIFSGEWSDAGRLTVFVLPWITVNFILSPLSHAYTVLRKQNINLILNILSIILKTVIIYSSFTLSYSFFTMIALYGITNLLLAVLQIFVIFHLMKLKKSYISSYIIAPLVFSLAVSYIINLLLSPLVSIIITTLIILLYFLLNIRRLKELLP